MSCSQIHKLNKMMRGLDHPSPTPFQVVLWTDAEDRVSIMSIQLGRDPGEDGFSTGELCFLLRLFYFPVSAKRIGDLFGQERATIKMESNG
jgi:hypothetical protein